MNTETGGHISELERIASRPARVRRFALLLLGALLIVFVAGYLWSVSNPEFKMKGLPPTLSKEVAVVVDGYSRVEVAADGSNFTVTAKRATTFIDNHQEFESVRIEFPGAGGPDIVLADRAVLLPGNGNGFRLFLQEGVDLTSSTGLRVKTSSMVYDNRTSLGETDGPVEFERGELSGTATGASYDSRSGAIDLLGKVSIKGVNSGDPSGEMSKLGVSRLDVTASRGVVSARDKTISLKEGVRFVADVLPDSRGPVPSSLSAKSIEIKLDGNEPSHIKSSGDVKAEFLPTKTRSQKISIEGDDLNAKLTEGDEVVSILGRVKIAVADNNGSTTEFSAPRLSYQFKGGRISGDGGVKIERRIDGNVEIATANRIEYLMDAKEFVINERARFVSTPDYFEADKVRGKFGAKNQLTSLIGEGSARVGREDSRGNSETIAKRFEAGFNANGQLRSVTASGPVTSKFVSETSGGSSTQLFAPTSVRLAFNESGNPSNLVTQGRTTLKLNDENGGGKSGTLVADVVSVKFDQKNQGVRAAEAKGNAEIIVPEDPGSSTKVNAEGFFCDFTSASIKSNDVNRLQKRKVSERQDAIHRISKQIGWQSYS